MPLQIQGATNTLFNLITQFLALKTIDENLTKIFK
jgi:hypothetical protein